MDRNKIGNATNLNGEACSLERYIKDIKDKVLTDIPNSLLTIDQRKQISAIIMVYLKINLDMVIKQIEEL
jgi:hypothetical protein